MRLWSVLNLDGKPFPNLFLSSLTDTVPVRGTITGTYTGVDKFAEGFDPQLRFEFFPLKTHL